MTDVPDIQTLLSTADLSTMPKVSTSRQAKRNFWDDFTSTNLESSGYDFNHGIDYFVFFIGIIWGGGLMAGVILKEVYPCIGQIFEIFLLTYEMLFVTNAMYAQHMPSTVFYTNVLDMYRLQ